MANIKSIPPQQEGRIIARVSALTILGNILLTVFKLFAGIAGHSGPWSPTPSTPCPT